jgi:hypothetical protein
VPTTSQRGYGAQHVAQRKAWVPRVQAGTVLCHAKVCLMPNRTIVPGTPWDLGHTEDRTAWTGPEHRRCNRADGGRRRGRRSRKVWKL